MKCEDAHYNMLRGMYFDGEKDIGDAKIVWSNAIDDSIWNYATRIDTQNSLEIIKRASSFLLTKNRNPTFYLTPACRPSSFSKILESQGFVNEYSDAWMFFKGSSKDIEIPSGIDIGMVKNLGDMDLFCDIYNGAYSSGSGQYSFPEEYGLAVLASFKNQTGGVIAEHYLAYVDGPCPVGILSLISKDSLFGIYNIGTLPSFEGIGIGSALTLFAVKRAIEMDASEIFLQTEKDSPNEGFYGRRGFETKFLSMCYVKH